MQALDPSGAYTDAEVKSALAGASGTRSWDFRYARLDSSNNFIENIDYVKSCTISNDSLADIKRTAKFEILDTGTLNYLSDRIQPFARLNMPNASQSYADYVASLQPDQHFTFDGAAIDPNISTYTSTNTGTASAISTFSTARAITGPTLSFLSSTSIAASGATGNVAWFYIDISGPYSVTFNTRGAPLDAQFYFQTGTTQADLILLASNNEYSLIAPSGRYYFKLTATGTSTTVFTATVDIVRAVNVVDKITTNSYRLNAAGQYVPGLLNDGGYALGSSLGRLMGFYPDSVTTNTAVGPAVNGSMSLSYWTSIDNTANSYSSVVPNVGGTLKIDFTVDTGLYVANKSRLSMFIGAQYWVIAEMPMLASGLYNITYTMLNDTVNSVFTVYGYINGKLAGSVVIPYATTHVVDGNNNPVLGITDVISSGSQYTGPSFYSSWTTDDISFFYNKTLTSDQVLNLYNKGVLTTPPRKGYVEWPQGIFLLSSPKRSLKNGTVIHEVDAYDQLQVLKEDSLDARLSFPIGTRLVDAVNTVFTKSIGKYQTFPLTAPGWSDTSVAPGSTTVNSDTSITLQNTTSGVGQAIFGSWDIKTVFDGFSFSAKMPASPQVTYLMANALDANFPAPYNQIYIVQSGTTLQFTIGGFYSGASFGVTYNPVQHAYVKMTELNRKIYFYTSPDGITWTQQYSCPLPYRSGSLFNMQLEFDYANKSTSTPYTTTLTEVYAKAYAQPTSKIIDSPLTMTVPMTWQPGTSKLQVINDLLAALNYESAWFDENGIFVARPYISPATRGSAFTYATDSNSVITGDVNQTLDLFGVANKWILAITNPDRPPIVSTYTNANPLSPTSTVSRGRTIVDFRTEQDTVDQTTLNAKVARLAFEASQVYEIIEYTTGMMPFHSNNDVYNISIDDLSVSDKYSELSWSLDLKVGSTMSHKVRRIVQL